MEDIQARYKELLRERNLVLERLNKIKKKKYLLHRRRAEKPPAKRSRSRSPKWSTEKPPEIVDAESEQRRNRNMFRSMLGHLTKAKTILNADLPRIKQQQETTQRITEEMNKQSEEMRNQYREEMRVIII